MPEKNTQPIPIVYGSLTAEEASFLQASQNPETDEHVTAILIAHNLGHVLASEGNAYALVTSENDNEGSQGEHYIYMGLDDLGTVITPENAKRIGLPELLAKRKVNRDNLGHQDKPSFTDQYLALLQEPDTEVSLSDLTAAKESDRSARLVKLFAPRLTEAEAPRPNDQVSMTAEYYRILNEDENKNVSANVRDRPMRDAAESSLVPEITDDQRTDALIRLSEAEKDPYIKAIVSKYLGNLRDGSSIDIIRKNEDLRYELGSYLMREKLPLLRKLDPHALPDRVFSRTEKNPNHKGYRHLGKVNSEEYSSMLALAMLDGTFIRVGKGDPIERKELSRVIVGQHRAAAVALLAQSDSGRRYVESTLFRE